MGIDRRQFMFGGAVGSAVLIGSAALPVAAQSTERSGRAVGTIEGVTNHGVLVALSDGRTLKGQPQGFPDEWELRNGDTVVVDFATAAVMPLVLTLAAERVELERTVATVDGRGYALPTTAVTYEDESRTTTTVFLATSVIASEQRVIAVQHPKRG